MDDVDEGTDPWSWHGPWTDRVVATSIHAGHDVRTELAQLMSLDEEVRLREEDPHTDELISQIPSRVEVRRSRFEVDLNRDRDGAVYRTPEDCWDLDVWHTGELAADLVETSARLHDRFYAELAQRLDPLAARGPFVLLDVHSYNHRRDGADAPAAPEVDNPEVNVGTGSLDRERFGPVVDAFMTTLGGWTDEDPSARHTPNSVARLDVRENVRFKGAHLARWVHERYPGAGCVLAIEFKKTFMDEWTGQPDDQAVAALARALAATIPALESALDELPES